MYRAVGAYFRKRCPVRYIEPWTRERLLADVPASRRKVVRESQEYVRQHGLGQKDFRVSAFPKKEKAVGPLVEEALATNVSPLQEKTDREIQFRRPPATYELARGLRPLEHSLFARRDGVRVPSEDRWFAKGMNSWQIAGNLRKKWDKFAHPVALLLDHSKFDAHLNWEMREEIEWSYYRACLRSPKMAYLLKQQGVNYATASCGIKYKVRGTMMSGEYNTSLGDCIVNLACLLYWIHVVCGVEDAEMLVNGDDSVVILDRSRLHQVDVSWFETFGMKTKCERADNFGSVDFCQCKPVEVRPNVWRMVREPARVISRCSYTDKCMVGRGKLKLLGAIAAGELACNEGVPILEAYAKMLERSAQGELSEALRDEHLARRGNETVLGSTGVHPVARVSFEESFGISPWEQREWERFFNEATLDVL
jgi:hypothetical protein